MTTLQTLEAGTLHDPAEQSESQTVYQELVTDRLTFCKLGGRVLTLEQFEAEYQNIALGQE